MVGWKDFYLDNPTWPQATITNTNQLMLVGIGRIIVLSLTSKYFVEALWHLVS